MSSIKKLIRDTKMKRGLLFLAIPGILFVLVFSYIPMFGVFIAFKKINYAKGIFGSDWVGIDNFKFFFTSGNFWTITRNTVLYNIAFIVFGLIVSLIFAVLLFELSKRAVKVYQTVFFLPYLLSWVVVGYIGYIFFNNDYGVLNTFIKLFGGDPISWYTEAKYWPFILVIINLWKSVGVSAIIYYTGLMGIDPSYYEAARIDGASKFQQIMKISIPNLLPLIVMLLILSLGSIIRSDFGMFYFLTQNSRMLYPTTDVIETYVYRALMGVGDPGMSVAVTLYQSVVGLVLILASNFIVRKIDSEKSLF